MICSNIENSQVGATVVSLSMLPTFSQAAVSLYSQHIIPTYTQPIAPTTFTQPIAPTYTHSVAPTYTQQVVPNYTQPIVPTFSQTVTQTYTQQVVPTFSQPSVQTYTQQVVPTFTQQVVPTYTPQVVPTYTQPVVPINTQSIVPLNTQPGNSQTLSYVSYIPTVNGATNSTVNPALQVSPSPLANNFYLAPMPNTPFNFDGNQLGVQYTSPVTLVTASNDFIPLTDTPPNGDLAKKYTIVGYNKSPTTKPSGRDNKAGWYNIHEKHKVMLLRKRAMVLICGDSIVAGLSRYHMVWNKHFRNLNAVNCGIGGDRTQHVLWRMENMTLPETLKFLVIHCGTNNIDRDSAQDIANGVISCGLVLQESRPELNVVVTGLLPRDLAGHSIRRKKIIQTNQYLKQYCKKFANFSFMKQDKDWVLENGQLNEELYYDDFLHLVEKGNDKLAASITNIITKLSRSEEICYSSDEEAPVAFERKHGEGRDSPLNASMMSMSESPSNTSFMSNISFMSNTSLTESPSNTSVMESPLGTNVTESPINAAVAEVEKKKKKRESPDSEKKQKKKKKRKREALLLGESSSASVEETSGSRKRLKGDQSSSDLIETPKKQHDKDTPTRLYDSSSFTKQKGHTDKMKPAMTNDYFSLDKTASFGGKSSTAEKFSKNFVGNDSASIDLTSDTETGDTNSTNKLCEETSKPVSKSKSKKRAKKTAAPSALVLKIRKSMEQAREEISKKKIKVSLQGYDSPSSPSTKEDEPASSVGMKKLISDYGSGSDTE